MENIKQEDHLVLKGAAKVLLQRMSVTGTSPLSDNNKKLIKRQRSKKGDRRRPEQRQAPLRINSAELYLPRKLGGRGLKSVEKEYKLTKIKVVVKLYSNPDPVMPVVRRYEENTEENGRRALIKGAKK